MPTPEWQDDTVPTTTVALLYQEFGDVLIPIEAVRMRYFRNRNKETFRRCLREGDIPLPVVTLDDSHKSPQWICLYQLAAYIEHRATESAIAREMAYDSGLDQRLLRNRLIDSVPQTDFRPVPCTAETPAQPGHHAKERPHA
jgi:hypothetical protein